MKSNNLFESPIAVLERSKLGKMLEEIQHNLNIAKGELYSLISHNIKKSATTSRKCLDNIRAIAFMLKKEILSHKKSMPIRKIRRKAKENANA